MTSPLDSIPLACPLDGLALKRDDNCFSCDRKHTYDLARQGYVYLLPVQFKSSLEPGDSKSMVLARRSVLELHHFLPLGQALCNQVLGHADFLASKAGCLIDAGCGEGYYTNLLAEQLQLLYPAPRMPLLGVDISKWSVQAAAKKYPNVAFSVASNKRLPICNGAANAIISLFGFETWQPWSELQTTEQLVFVVDAGPHHLLELREKIYSEVRIHDAPDHPEAVKAGYVLIHKSQVTYSTVIESARTLLDILEMTPHGRRTDHELLNKIAEIDTMSLTIDAVVRTYRRA